MTEKPLSLTLSIVIPVYNEERYLKNCLDAIAVQTVAPDEVIVVDNNSSDDTLIIAKSYPFVKVIFEKRQGQVFAQAKAFDCAKSEILGRIDADTILPKNWVKKIKSEFTASPEVIAVTGVGVPYDVPFRRLGSFIFRLYHSHLTRILTGHTMLWGSNCAFRQAAWFKLNKSMHKRVDLWEDYDMSFHLAAMGKIKYVPSIKITCSFRAAHKSLIHQVRYQIRAVRTIRLHCSWWRVLLFGMVWSTLLLVFPVTVLDHFMWKLKHKK